MWRNRGLIALLFGLNVGCASNPPLPPISGELLGRWNVGMSTCQEKGLLQDRHHDTVGDTRCRTGVYLADHPELRPAYERGRAEAERQIAQGTEAELAEACDRVNAEYVAAITALRDATIHGNYQPAARAQPAAPASGPVRVIVY